MSLPEWERGNMYTKMYFTNFDVPDGTDTYWANMAKRMAPSSYKQNIYDSIITQKAEYRDEAFLVWLSLGFYVEGTYNNETFWAKSV